MRPKGRAALPTDGIHDTIQLDVADGKMPEFENLTQEACDGCEANEPGALVYRWQIDDSGSRVQLHERFTDEAAMMAHMGGPAATDIFPN